jgi:hypothetical protein
MPWLVYDQHTGASFTKARYHGGFASTYYQPEVEIVVCRLLRNQIWNGMEL